MNLKSITKQLIISLLILSLLVNVCIAAVSLDAKFLKSNTGSSSVYLPVEQLVEIIENVKLDDGSHPKIIGWQRKGNSYTFTFIAAKKIVLNFKHLINQGGEWSSISALADGKPIDALALIMQIISMPRNKTKSEIENEVRAQKEKARIEKEAYVNLPGEYRKYKYSSDGGIDHQLFVTLNDRKVKMESNYDCQILEKEVPITKVKDTFVAEYNEQACKITATFYINDSEPSKGSIILRNRGDCSAVCNKMPPTDNCCPVIKVDNSFIAKAAQAKEKGDYVTALEIYQNERNAPEAGLLLGRMYLKGEGVKQDYDRAISYFYRASERGNANATVELINLVADNKVDPNTSSYGSLASDIDKLYKLAANQGHSQIQYLYAIKLYNKAKIETDREDKDKIIDSAYMYLKKSAKKGYKDAIELLSKIDSFVN